MHSFLGLGANTTGLRMNALHYFHYDHCWRQTWVKGRTKMSCLARQRPVEPASIEERRRPEDVDPNYRRVDFSELHAYDARMAFLRNIARGEAAVDLADAALQIAAEDDALVSHSSVPLPVTSFHQRLERLADEVAQVRLKPLLDAGVGNQELLDAVQLYIFHEKGFRPTPFGRSNLPGLSLVDSPGVWEDARNAYLHEALIRRQGIPAVLTIVLADVLRRLLRKGVVDFVAVSDVTDLGAAPSSRVLPWVNRGAAVGSDGRVLNTCSTDTLVEMLRFLKRSYWPFPWDERLGGFIGAAEVAIQGQQGNAELEAIARTAQHRLERGIWTSPGAGDLRRALAAVERLVVLCGESCPKERRDLAVLYLHCGRLGEASVELRHFAERAAKEQEAAPLWQSLHEQTLVDQLLEGLGPRAGGGATPRATSAQSASGSAGGPNAAEAAPRPPVPLTLEAALRRRPPPVETDKKLPLTW